MRWVPGLQTYLKNSFLMFLLFIYSFVFFRGCCIYVLNAIVKIWATLFCLLLQTFHTTPSPTQTSLIVKTSTFWDYFLKIKKRNGRSLTRSTRWDGSRAFKPISKIRFWCFKGSVLDSGLCEKAPKKLPNQKISKARLSRHLLGSYRTQVVCRI